MVFLSSSDVASHRSQGKVKVSVPWGEEARGKFLSVDSSDVSGSSARQHSGGPKTRVMGPTDNAKDTGEAKLCPDSNRFSLTSIASGAGS